MDSKTNSDDFHSPVAAEILSRLPAPIQASYRCYLNTGDLNVADEVVLAILKDHVPSKKIALIPANLDDSSTLIGDFGIDSVSIADAVFVLEDVFDVSISNKDLVKLRTVGDLKTFLRSKLAKQSA